MRSIVSEGQLGFYPDAALNCELEVAVSAKKRKVDPAVKAWLDNVLVPAMVRLYLAANNSGADNGVVPVTERVQ